MREGRVLRGGAGEGMPMGECGVRVVGEGVQVGERGARAASEGAPVGERVFI